MTFSFSLNRQNMMRYAAAAMLVAASFFISGGLAVAEPASTPSSGFPAPNDTVYAVATGPDGTVYIGGEFTQVGGQTRNHVAAISSSGQLLSWNPNIDGPVYTIVVSDSIIVVGGSFAHVGSESKTNVAILSDDGQLSPWGVSVNDAVNAVGLDSSDTVYIGGEFTQVEGQSRNHLASIANNSILNSWNPNANGSVAALVVSGTTVYIGGDFTQVAGQSRSNAARVTTSGSLDSWSPNPNNVVGSIAVSGTTVYLGGDFTQVGSTSRSFAAAVNSTDGTVLSWNPSPNQSVLNVTVNGSSIYLGGFFTQVGDKLRNNAASVDASGVASSWNPNTNGPVAGIATSGTTVYLAGNFTQVGAQTSPYVAKFTASGSDPVPYPTPYTTPYATPYATPTSIQIPDSGSGKTLEDIADSLEYGDLISFNDTFPVYFAAQDGLYPFATNEGLIAYMQQSGKTITDVTDNPALYPDIIKTASAESVLGTSTAPSGSGSGSSTKKYATGSLVSDGGTVYLIHGSKKIAFTSFNAFNGLGYSLANVVTGNLSAYQLAQSYWIDSATLPHPWGSWVKYNHTIYYVHESGLIGVPTLKAFTNNGGKQKYVLPINQADIEILNLAPNLPVLQNTDSRVYK